MDDNSVPGFTAPPDLEAKLDGLDDNLLPKDQVNEDKKDEPAKPKEEPKKDDKADEAAKDDEPKEDSDKSADTEGDAEVSDEGEEDEGYAIDDGEEDDKPEDKKPTETSETTPDKSQLSPEQQYIIDNIQPITVKGTVGDDKVQEFKVYSPEQLPDGFKYLDDKGSATANKAFSMLESKAIELQNDFRSQESTKSAQAFKEAEDTADRADIGKLQRDGELPKFKLEVDDPKFATDPATVQIQEILDFKDKKNAEYLEAANAGRPYKHIGFEEAYLMYKRENPASDPAQDKEDAERKALSKRTRNTVGDKSVEDNKPRVHSGMGSMDLDNLIEKRTHDW